MYTRITRWLTSLMTVVILILQSATVCADNFSLQDLTTHKVIIENTLYQLAALSDVMKQYESNVEQRTDNMPLSIPYTYTQSGQMAYHLIDSVCQDSDGHIVMTLSSSADERVPPTMSGHRFALIPVNASGGDWVDGDGAITSWHCAYDAAGGSELSDYSLTEHGRINLFSHVGGPIATCSLNVSMVNGVSCS